MKLTEEQKKYIKPAIIVICVILLVIIIVPSKKGKIKTTLKTSLEKVVEKSDLETATITYNIIAKKCKKDGCDKNSNDIDDFEYVLSCDGTVTAGIDFSKVEVEVKSKKVIVHLPDATIMDEPNIGSVKFLNGKEIKGVEYADARKFCQEEVKAKSLNDNRLLPAAKKQTMTVLEDFYKQWIKSYDPSYEVAFE